MEKELLFGKALYPQVVALEESTKYIIDAPVSRDGRKKVSSSTNRLSRFTEEKEELRVIRRVMIYIDANNDWLLEMHTGSGNTAQMVFGERLKVHIPTCPGTTVLYLGK